MSRGFQGAILKGLGAQDHKVTVISKTEVAPNFLRLRFSAPSLFESLTWEPAAWLRFWFPDPAGGPREFQRAYTIVAAYPSQAEMEIDVVLHEPHGPASLWAVRAQPGDALMVMSYGSRFRMPQPEPAGFLLIGDPSSTPAINSIIAAASPACELELYLEQTRADDALIPLQPHPNLRLQRVERGDGAALAAAIPKRERRNWFAWAAGEATSIRAVRNALKEVHGFAAEAVHVQSYWVKGAAGRH
jgi:ATP-binding cassette subfamily B protein IrtA